MTNRGNSLIHVLVMLLVLGAGWSTAQASEPWRSHLDAGRQAQRDREWKVADAAFDQALSQAREAGATDGSEVEILESWSRSALARGRKDIAADLLEQAVALRRSGADAVSSETLEVMIRLGNLYRQVGPYESAESVFRQALALHDETGEDGPGRLNRLLRGLDTTLMRLRPDDPERETLLLRNLAASESPDRHFQLGNYYRTNALYDDSIRLFDEAIALLERRHPVDHTKLASYLVALGQAREGLGQVAEAEVDYFRALELSEALFGPSHPRLSYTLKRIGAMYLDQGRYVEAEGHLRRALQIEHTSHGDELDVCGCSVLDMLARVEEALGGSIEAATAPVELQQHVTREDARLDELDVLEQEIENLRRRGEFEAGLERAAKALQLREELFGAQSRQAAEGQRKIARLLIRRTRHEEAIEMLKSYAGSLEQFGDTSSSHLADTFRDLATSLRRLGHPEEAVEYFAREVDIREALGQRLQAARRLESLGHVVESLDENDAARTYFERAESLWVEMAGAQAPEIVRLRAAVATTLIGQERFDEAESMLEGLMDDIEARELDNPSLRRYVLRAMRDLYRETDRQDERNEMISRLQELR